MPTRHIWPRHWRQHVSRLVESLKTARAVSPSSWVRIPRPPLRPHRSRVDLLIFTLGSVRPASRRVPLGPAIDKRSGAHRGEGRRVWPRASGRLVPVPEPRPGGEWSSLPASATPVIGPGSTQWSDRRASGVARSRRRFGRPSAASLPRCQPGQAARRESRQAGPRRHLEHTC
jgi:hypothetical protein